MSEPGSYEVIIAGAGPAGSSAAIRLATRGAKVLLVEQKKFPRAKLCGEFISPECDRHFRELGVAAEIAASFPATITETVFYSSSGRNIKVPSDWFNEPVGAIGLSRAEMDYRLLLKAKGLGVTVLEGASISGVLTDGHKVTGLSVWVDGQNENYSSPITIDATGRTRAVVRKLNNQSQQKLVPSRPKLVAFKVHLENTREQQGACEIYSYAGGYGGLSAIEHGISNLCFIAAASDVRRCNSDADIVVQDVVSKNRRADFTLKNAQRRSEWLSVSLENFGRHSLVPSPGLLTVGDAAAFIDPFTGSGMLMAFESGELASNVVPKYLNELKEGRAFDLFAQAYKSSYQAKFDSRLRLSGLLRRVAFIPYAAEAAILFFSVSDRLRRRTAQATRSNRHDMIVEGPKLH
jgi:menaquinone-9 beta-reductase